jgi:transcriptional regulator with XRE-family HTH domain
MTNLELKQIRLENGLKQSDIAELLGIKQSNQFLKMPQIQ